MSEWWTYSLSDFLLFSPRTYYRLFELHNAAIWPGQFVAIALGIAILALLRSPGMWQGRVISGILAACWLWVAWTFLIGRYADINWTATYFGGFFAVEALLLVVVGVVWGKLRFGEGKRAGIGLFLFALLIQPLIGPVFGRAWSQAEVFGIAPDPTVVGTLGILALATHGSRWLLLVIPVLWCAVSGATLWTMRSPDALILPAAAVVAVGMAVRAPRN